MKGPLALLLALSIGAPARAGNTAPVRTNTRVGSVGGNAVASPLVSPAPVVLAQPGLLMPGPSLVTAVPSALPTPVLAQGLRQSLPQAMPFIQELAQGADPGRAQAAAATLSATADPALLAALAEPDPAAALSRLAGRLKGDAGSRDVVEALEKAASYGSPLLRRVAGHLGEQRQALSRSLADGSVEQFLGEKMDQSRSRTGGVAGKPLAVASLQGGRWVPVSPASGGLKAAPAPAAPRKAGVFHENDIAKVVVMHEPGQETSFSNAHPASALFTGPVDWQRAAGQHAAYRKALEAAGLQVRLVKDILLEGTIDAEGEPVKGPALDALREFAGRSLRYDTSKLAAEHRRAKRAVEKLPEGPYKKDALAKLAALEAEITPGAQEAYRQEALAKLSPQTLVETILNRPTIELHLQTKTRNETYYAGLFQRVRLEPISNLYFSRDQQITTQKGIVISNLSFVQRRPEAKVMRFVFEKLGLPIVTELTKGTMDGGDYVPAGDLVFLGQGLRTSAGAVKQLLEEDAFGATEVAVVKDAVDQSMDRMHLDTVFNLVGEKKAVALQDLFTDPARRRTVDLYRRAPTRGLKNAVGHYVKVAENKEFGEFLKDRGFEVAAVTHEEQLQYATNFLNVGDGHIITPFGGGRYLKMLRDMGLTVRYVPMNSLTDGYGAAHCMTQVVLREPRTPDGTN
ncbi:MAG: hypothetical protein HYZ75_14930 [Elusimicrobia bacterium]|nr:hypothetical protein [Elusimicrobiota bacterium]